MGFLTFAVLGRLFASRVGFVVLAVLAVGVAPGRWPGAAVRLFLMEGLQVGFLRSLCGPNIGSSCDCIWNRHKLVSDTIGRRTSVQEKRVRISSRSNHCVLHHPNNLLGVVAERLVE